MMLIWLVSTLGLMKLCVYYKCWGVCMRHLLSKSMWSIWFGYQGTWLIILGWAEECHPWCFCLQIMLQIWLNVFTIQMLLMKTLISRCVFKWHLRHLRFLIWNSIKRKNIWLGLIRLIPMSWQTQSLLKNSMADSMMGSQQKMIYLIWHWIIRPPSGQIMLPFRLSLDGSL